MSTGEKWPFPHSLSASFLWQLLHFQRQRTSRTMDHETSWQESRNRGPQSNRTDRANAAKARRPAEAGTRRVEPGNQGPRPPAGSAPGCPSSPLRVSHRQLNKNTSQEPHRPTSAPFTQDSFLQVLLSGDRRDLHATSEWAEALQGGPPEPHSSVHELTCSRISPAWLRWAPRALERGH